MANTKISQLTALSNPTWSEEFVYAFNNANGKVTLNTMKTFVQPNLGWYQEKLVNQVNIKSINNQSLLWSWNITISWWWWGSETSYDCVVDANWWWDYTTIWAAINAGNQYIFVKNWTYNETVWRDPYTNSISTLHIIWESEKWVQITIPESITTTNGYVIDMRYNDSADFYMENLTFNITLSSTNKIFYIDNWWTNFYVKNCSFTYTTTNTGWGATANNIFYTKIIWNWSSFSNMPFGFYDCYFTTETTYIVNIAYQNLYAYWCYFYSAAWRIQLAQTNYQSILRECVINTFALGWTYDMVIFDSNITVWDENWWHIYSHNYNQLHIAMISDSVFTLWTLTETPEIELWVCLNSNLWFWSYAIAWTWDYNSNRAISNSYIVCGAITWVSNITWSNVSWTSIALVARWRVIWNVFWTTLTTITCTSADSILSWNVFRWTWTFALSWTRDIITSNSMVNITLTDTWTDNVKANNVTAN